MPTAILNSGRLLKGHAAAAAIVLFAFGAGVVVADDPYEGVDWTDWRYAPTMTQHGHCWSWLAANDFWGAKFTIDADDPTDVLWVQFKLVRGSGFDPNQPNPEVWICADVDDPNTPQFEPPAGPQWQAPIDLTGLKGGAGEWRDVKFDFGGTVSGEYWIGIKMPATIGERVFSMLGEWENLEEMHWIWDASGQTGRYAEKGGLVYSAALGRWRPYYDDPYVRIKRREGYNFRPKVETMTIEPNPASAGVQTVTFTGSGSDDPPGSVVGYEWGIAGTERTERVEQASFSRVFDTVGTYRIKFRVRDDGALGGGGQGQPRWSEYWGRTLTVQEPTPPAIGALQDDTYDPQNPDRLGTFISGVETASGPVENTYSVIVNPGSYTLDRVTFEICNRFGTVVLEQDATLDPNDQRWYATFNVSDLAADDYEMRATVYFVNHPSASVSKSFQIIAPRPWWGQDWVGLESATWDGAKYTLTGVFPWNPRMWKEIEPNLVLPVLGEVENCGGLQMDITDTFCAANDQWTYGAEGGLELVIMSQPLIDEPFDIWHTDGYDGNYEWYWRSPSLVLPPVEVYEQTLARFSTYFIDVALVLTVSFGMTADLGLSGVLDSSLQSEEFCIIPGVMPQVPLDLHVDGWAGAVSVGLVNTPRLGIDLPICYDDDESPPVYFKWPCIEFGMSVSAYAAAARGLFTLSTPEYELFDPPFTWGEGCGPGLGGLSDPREEPAVSPFQSPRIASDGYGNAMCVWIHDHNHGIPSPDPDVYYSYFNGEWSTPAPVATTSVFETDPRVVFTGPGQALLVVTQDQPTGQPPLGGRPSDGWNELEVIYNELDLACYTYDDANDTWNFVELFSEPASGPTCQHSITMWDDFGDGWNGGYLDVYVAGELVLAGVTMAGSGPETVYFDAGTDDEITTIWEPGGWPYECSYCIYGGDETMLGCDGMYGTEPTGITVFGYCPPSPGPRADGRCELAAHPNGDAAVAVWVRDPDGYLPNADPNNPNPKKCDTDIYVSMWSNAAGTWTEPQPLARGSQAYLQPDVAYSPNGSEIVVVWAADEDGDINTNRDRSIQYSCYHADPNNPGQWIWTPPETAVYSMSSGMPPDQTKPGPQWPTVCYDLMTGAPLIVFAQRGDENGLLPGGQEYGEGIDDYLFSAGSSPGSGGPPYAFDRIYPVGGPYQNRARWPRMTVFNSQVVDHPPMAFVGCRWFKGRGADGYDGEVGITMKPLDFDLMPSFDAFPRVERYTDDDQLDWQVDLDADNWCGVLRAVWVRPADNDPNAGFGEGFDSIKLLEIPLGPDLGITSENVTCSSPYPLAGEQTELTAWIRNSGTRDIPGAVVGFYLLPSSEPCEHSVGLCDSSGDGWNGCTLDVLVNGEIVLDDITLDGGYGPATFTFEAVTGDEISTRFTSGGDPQECSYCVYDGGGNELGCDGLDGQVPGGISVMGLCVGAGGVEWEQIGSVSINANYQGVSTASITWTADGLPHDLVVVVDDGDMVAEVNEANNTAVITLTAMAPPGNLSLTEVPPPTAALVLSWTPPNEADPASPPAWVYRVYRDTGDGFELLGESVGTQYADHSVTTASYLVTAVNESGGESAPVGPVSGTVPAYLDNGIVRASFTDYGTSGDRLPEGIAADIAWLPITPATQVFSWEGNLRYDDGTGVANHLLADADEFAVTDPLHVQGSSVASGSRSDEVRVAATHSLDGATLTTELTITNVSGGELTDVNFAWMLDANLVLSEADPREPCCTNFPWLGYGAGRWLASEGWGELTNLNECAGIVPADIAVTHTGRLDGSEFPNEWTVSNPSGFQGSTCAFDGSVEGEPRYLFELPFDDTEGYAGPDQDLCIVTKFEIPNWPAGAAHTFIYTLTFADQATSGDCNGNGVLDESESVVSDITAEGSFVGRIFSLSPPHPLGIGNRDPEVMRDGDYPPIGNEDTLRQYDTFHEGDQGDEDWIGYEFAETKMFRSIIFQEGIHFWDGGWFDELQVQVRTEGIWSDVIELEVDPAYPGDNNVNCETFTLTFEPTLGDAIRMYGNPGGSGNFISVGEFRVIAGMHRTLDCNGNGVLDECDIAGGTSEDYDLNGVPDECEDCTGNGIPDACDVDCAVGDCSDHPLGCGGHEDCNGNLNPDECIEFEGDCNDNGVPDECDIADGTSDDHDLSGVPDECEDCNGNGVPDGCDLDCATGNCAAYYPGDCGGSDDCNKSGVPDECDIADGTSDDCNGNGYPDQCELSPFPILVTENTSGRPDSIYTGPPDDVCDGIGGRVVTYDFGLCRIVDLEGPDFNVYERDCEVPEFNTLDVLVSVDGIEFVSVKGTEGAVVHIPGDEAHSDDAFARSYDLGPAGLSAARYVSLDGDGDLPGGGYRGFDLDAIGVVSFFGDCNGNGVPNECDCRGDVDGDCSIDLSDLAQLLANYGMTVGATYHDGDLDGDGDVDLSDLAALLSVYGATCD
jgi:hypothetical protein